MSEKGYVYILTNPSFKENWVKIGKTARTVEQRVSELDTTGVPLPFEVFAKLRTANYERAEKLIHKMIDLLTDKRVRKGREFFNIDPWTALEIFEDVAEMLDDAEITQVACETAERKSSSAQSQITETGAMLIEFWGALKKYVNEKAPHLMKFMSQKHFPNNYYDVHVGLNCCHVILGGSVMHQWVKIGIWSRGDEELQKLLKSKKGFFEKAVNGEMEVGGNKCLSMYTYHHDFDIKDRNRWPEAFDWYIEKFPLLRDAMHKVVGKD